LVLAAAGRDRWKKDEEGDFAAAVPLLQRDYRAPTGLLQVRQYEKGLVEAEKTLRALDHLP